MMLSNLFNILTKLENKKAHKKAKKQRTSQRSKSNHVGAQVGNAKSPVECASDNKFLKRMSF